MRSALVFAITVVLVVSSLGAGDFVATSGQRAASSQGLSLIGETIFIHVADSTSGKPIANESVRAGPAASLNDLTLTFGFHVEALVNDCVHEVPNGSAVFPSGNIVVSNGTTTTFAPCPMMTYYTNSTGWVTITGQTASYFLIQVGTEVNSDGSNAKVIPIVASMTYVQTTFPEGSFTVTSSGQYLGNAATNSTAPAR